MSGEQTRRSVLKRIGAASMVGAGVGTAAIGTTAASSHGDTWLLFESDASFFTKFTLEFPNGDYLHYKDGDWATDVVEDGYVETEVGDPKPNSTEPADSYTFEGYLEAGGEAQLIVDTDGDWDDWEQHVVSYDDHWIDIDAAENI